MNCMHKKWSSMIHCNFIMFVCMLAMLSSNGCSKTPEKQPEEKQDQVQNPVFKIVISNK